MDRRKKLLCPNPFGATREPLVPIQRSGFSGDHSPFDPDRLCEGVSQRIPSRMTKCERTPLASDPLRTRMNQSEAGH